MTFMYLSDQKIYLYNGKEATLLPSKRHMKYLESAKSIQNSKLWKTTGRGAEFMQQAERPRDIDAQTQVCYGGFAAWNGELVYSLRLDDLGGLYIMPADPAEETERHVFSRTSLYVGGIAAKGDRLAFCLGANCHNLHLSIVTLPGGAEREFTDGDTIEESPCWSVGEDVVYCTSAGYARQAGNVEAVGPRAICALNPSAGTFEELLCHAQFDYLRPSDDVQGNLYYIRQPYREKGEESNWLKDIALFPLRIVRAIGGLLNYFSILFGGEPLHSGGTNSKERAKQKSKKELFFEGNLIQAEENLRASEKSGEKFPGILPRSRVLVQRAPDGTETVLKKGVLDYCRLPDGSFLCSNGQSITHLTPQGEELVVRAKLATKLTLLPDAPGQ